eukprot:4025118-Prymnesium_polylepis.1
MAGEGRMVPEFSRPVSLVTVTGGPRKVRHRDQSPAVLRGYILQGNALAELLGEGGQARAVLHEDGLQLHALAQ